MNTTFLNGLPVLQFPHLSHFGELRHAIFTRQGGISSAPYKSLNISFNVGDRVAAVEANRRTQLSAMRFDKGAYIKQVHGTSVLVLNKGKFQKKCRNFVSIGEGDALVTDMSDILLLIQVADCQAILLYEPSRRVIANIHSGWRGSVRNIIQKTIRLMADRFGAMPRRIEAGVSPSLGPCCSEFVNYKKEIPQAFWNYRVGAARFDFWEISRQQLLDAGLSAQNIIISEICTHCNTDRFNSYRKEGVTGRFSAVIGLKTPVKTKNTA